MDNVRARCFSIFQENKNDLLKVDKDFEVFKTAFFHLPQLSFELDGLFTASVYLAKKRPFRSLSFSLQEKFDPRIEVYLWKTNLKVIVCRNSTRILQEDDVSPRVTGPPVLSVFHAKNETTNIFGYKLGESTENNKALLFFSSKEAIQTFNGSI